MAGLTQDKRAAANMRSNEMAGEVLNQTVVHLINFGALETPIQ